MRPIIRVENLGKQYRTGERKAAYATLRETLTRAAWAPFNRIRKVWQNGLADPGGASGRTLGNGHTGNLFWALKNASFEVWPGEVVGIVGHNGAGKSTLLKVLSRITDPTTGQADTYGRVGSLLEVGTGFHPELTGRENIYLSGAILGMRRSEIDRKFDEIIAFADINEYLDTPVKRYSSGMYVRLGFAVAAHLDPEILLVDEVLAVGDVAFRKKCLGKIGNVAREGRTVLFVSHQMDMIRHLCDRVILLERGRVKTVGNTSDVVSEYLASLEEPETGQAFPIVNREFGVSIDHCATRLVRNAANQSLDLVVRLRVNSSQVRRRIGIGFALFTGSGTKVAGLPPHVTNYVFDLREGANDFIMKSANLDNLLTPGDYSVSVWLGMVGACKLAAVDRGQTIAVPSKDRFGTGQVPDVDYDGPLSLPLVVYPCSGAADQAAEMAAYGTQ